MITYPNVKLNLGLRVLGRRDDGFHDLETVFIPYEGLHDMLEILPDAGDGATLISEAAWPSSKDLTVRAYELLKADFPSMPGVRITLSKHSPVGAGLGGGSADAAFALKMLSEMFDLSLDATALASYASRLGSDCAFFIYNTPMLGTGRGEILEPFDIDLSAYRIKVVVPEGVAISTAQAYRDLDKAGEAEDAMPVREALSRPIGQWRECLVNDFERVVFPLHPELPALKAQMYEEGAVYAAMSGSGSAIFGLFNK